MAFSRRLCERGRIPIGFWQVGSETDSAGKIALHPPVHLAISWLTGHGLAERRDRRLVAWSGVVPDLDALSLLGGVAAYSQYHHVLTHGVMAAVVGTALWTALARQRLKVFFGSLAAFHLHLICDLLGSGRDWPIVYWFPFSRHEFMTPYGWPLASPQNAIVWLVAVAGSSGSGSREDALLARLFCLRRRTLR